MDKTALVNQVAQLFLISGCSVKTSVQINFREIDVVATETQGLVRKVILIECADYGQPVGIEKLTADIQKLETARADLGSRAVVMHVSRFGYTQNAAGYALKHGVDTFTLEEITHRLVNFDMYIRIIDEDPLKEVILREYQPTAMHADGEPDRQAKALDFLDQWLAGSSRWLTVLGDYGVGKSWMLRRYLYHLLDRFKSDPNANPLPFFIPLQQFTKAFDYRNLILACFQKYGLGGIQYEAFEFLAHTGRVVFLLDSFDEMAQALKADTIRENLKELLAGVAHNSKAIMTSRPTYFERRAERLLVVETEGQLVWHPLDKAERANSSALSRFIAEQLTASGFARLNDLSIPQRMNLFRVVLGGKQRAHARLHDLFKRFQSLENISQRAVIARLLTTVAEALADDPDMQSAEGKALLPSNLEDLNEAKIFEIVVTKLLQRDVNIGGLNAADRLRFLRWFAVYLQRPGRSFFAEPEEIRSLVRSLFDLYLKTSDTPEQLLENYYRTCRRHSGLTTEGQFNDTSGNIDSPVDERDMDSRVGFSHNSIREYLVADAISDHLLTETVYPGLLDTSVTETIGRFFFDMMQNVDGLELKLRNAYTDAVDSISREWLFQLIYQLMRFAPSRMTTVLGSPAVVTGSDLCNRDLSGLALRGAEITHCIAADTDFRKSDLREAVFDGSILERAMFDGSSLQGANFTRAEVQSVFVYDGYERRTSAVLKGRDALQWLHARGAIVQGSDSLNQFLGQPWYEAAREVTRTLERRIAGTHQDISLVKGIDSDYREFAWEFVQYLIKANIIRRVKKAPTGAPGDWIVRVNQSHYAAIREFSTSGSIDARLKPFFDKQARKHRLN